MLTTDIWSSFADFCEQRGLDPEAAKSLFREDPDALAELRRAGDAARPTRRSSSAASRELLGTEPEGLIEGLFAGLASGRGR